MKNKIQNKNIETNQKAAKTEHHRKYRIWKIVAIAVVIIFAVFVVGSIIKVNQIKSSFVKPTQEQIDYATQIATEKLTSIGVNASEFQIKVGERMPKLHKGVERNIMQVLFYNNSTTHVYLVDVKSGEIISHSATEVYDSAYGSPRQPFIEKPMPSGEFGRGFSKQGDDNCKGEFKERK